MKIIILVGSLLMGILGGCGKGSGTVTISDLTNIPKATAGVASSAAITLTNLYASTAGIKIGDLGSATTTWNSTRSGPFCDTASALRDFLASGSVPDKYLCYLGAFAKAGKLSDHLDGKDHYFIISGVGQTKFKAVVSDGSISSFELFGCWGPSTQDTYFKVDLKTNGETTLTSWRTYNPGTHRNVVTGTINSSGQWAGTKKVVSYHSSDSPYSAYSELIQGTETLTLSGFYTVPTATRQFFAEMQGLGLNSLKTFALGDGSGKYSSTFVPGYSGTTSWTGDTQAPLVPASSGAYYSKANDATLMAVTTVSTALQTGETWDCVATGSSFPYLYPSDVATDIAACDDTFDSANFFSTLNCTSANYN